MTYTFITKKIKKNNMILINNTIKAEHSLFRSTISSKQLLFLIVGLLFVLIVTPAYSMPGRKADAGKFYVDKLNILSLIRKAKYVPLDKIFRDYQVRYEAGKASEFLIDNALEIQPEWLENVESIGVTAGASAPQVLVDEVLNCLKSYGGDMIDFPTDNNENMVFAVPIELR